MHDLDEAYLSQRRVLSIDPIEGSFIFGTGDLYYNTRIRFSGSPWARSAWGSFRLRFPTDNRLHGSVSQINLEQDQWGPTGGKGRTSHYFFRHLSRPESPVAYDIFRRITFSVNARAIGLRDHVHVPNGDTLEKFWPDDDRGDFFEMDDRFVAARGFGKPGAYALLSFSDSGHGMDPPGRSRTRRRRA